MKGDLITRFGDGVINIAATIFYLAIILAVFMIPASILYIVVKGFWLLLRYVAGANW